MMKSYIIGETAYNHEGDFDYLKKMVENIADIGLDAVKFHLLLKAESYLQKAHPIMDMIKGWMFSEKQWDQILSLSEEKGLDVVALCDDFESLEYINTKHAEIAAIELHMSCLNDYYMLKEAAKFPNRIILGVGGSTLDEIEYAVRFLKTNGKSDILLMSGFQAYPTNYFDINISKMLKLKQIFELPVGYADHTAYNDENNVNISSMASAMGFNILEKHYTPDFGVERIDHHAAVGKEHMKEIRNRMDLYLAVFGEGNISMSEPELKYGNTGPMKKAIVAAKPIKKGDKLTLENLWFKRTREESSIKQNQFLNLLGLSAVVDIEKDEIINFTKVEYEFKKVDFSDLTGGMEAKK